MSNSNSMGTWAKNFGSATKYSAVNVMKSIAPNTAEIIRSGRDSAYDIKKQVIQSKNSLKTAVSQFDRTSIGSKAKRTFDQAMKDIKSGNFGIQRIEREYSEYEFEMPDLPEDGTGIEQYEIAKLNQEATMASTIAAMEATKASTQAITKATLVSSQALGDSLTNTMMIGLNKINQNQMQANNYLKNIDTNIRSLLEFQNASTGTVNQAMMSYMTETQEAMSQIAEYFNNATKPTKRKGRNNKGDNLFRHGLDLSSYKEYLQENIAGFLPFSPDMVKDMAPLMLGGAMGGKSPAQKLLEFGLKMMIPKSMRKGAGRLDKNLPKYMRHSLLKLGDMANDPSAGFLQMLAGSIFGLQTPKLSKINLGHYKKDATTFDGTTKRAIEEVIPDLISKSNMYLAKIAGEKPTREFYDYDKGVFRDRNELQSLYKKNVQAAALDPMYLKMNELTTAIGKLDFGNMNDAQTKHMIGEMQKGISQIIAANISGEKRIGLTKSNDINELLEGVIQKKAISYINQLFGRMDRGEIVELEDAIFDSKISVAEMMQEIGSGSHGSKGVFRNLFSRGQDSKKATTEALKHMNLFDVYDAEHSLRESKLTQSQKHLREKSKEVNEKVKSTKDRLLSRGNSDSVLGRLNQTIENLTDKLDRGLYDIADGNLEGVASTASRLGTSAKKKTSNVSRRIKQIHMPRRRNQSQANTDSRGNAVNVSGSVDQYNQQLESNTRNLMNQLQNSEVEEGSTGVANSDGSLQASSQVIAQTYQQTVSAINESNKSQSNAFKGLVYGIYSTFLKPSYDKVFGKDGIIGKYIMTDRTKETMQKIKKYLFGEKNAEKNNMYEGGIMSGVANEFADAADYMKYVFTGKGYTNRKGQTYADNQDKSVFGYITNGFKKVGSYLMQYIFGEDYENNKNYQKSFGKLKTWWANRRNGGRIIDESEEVQQEDTGDIKNMNTESMKENYKLQTSINRNRLKRPTSYDRTKALRVKSASRSIKTQSTDKNSSSEDLEAASEDAPSILMHATAKAASEIEKVGKTVREITLGKNSENENKTKKSIITNFKSKLPKIFLGGILGGAAIAASGGSLGLIGSLFLPNSIIGGAMVGMGTMFATQTEKFKKLMFGEKDEDGKRTGGLIKAEHAKSLKKALPIIIGGGALGAMKSVLGFGTGGPLGVVTSALLPGGLLGGALMGAATSLIIRNEKFQKIAFGEKDEDGKRTGGKLSNFMNKGSAILQKSFNFITGAGKGLLVGGLSAKIIGEMGVLGAALTPFGPLGGALLGASIGIASQTERFKKLLFGEKDEETGKRTGGLLTKFANMVNINLVEPGKLWFKDMVAETGYAIHDYIVTPIKDILKPIGDTVNDIKTSIEDAVHAAFEKIAEKVTDTFEKVLAPIGNFFVKWILKPLGSFAGNTIKGSIKSTAALVGAPLKIVSSIVNFKRTKNHLSNKWRERGGKGFGEVLHRGWDILNIANPFNNEKTQEELEYDEERRAERKERRNERKLLSVRQKWQKEDKYAERELSAKEYKLRRNKLLRLGISEDDIQSQSDLNDYLYRGKLRSKTEEDIKNSQQNIEKSKEETKDYRTGVHTRLDRLSNQLDTLIGGKTNVDSRYENSFSGRRDLSPREREDISNTAEAIHLGMSSFTNDTNEANKRLGITNSAQGLSFKKEDKKEDNDSTGLLLNMPTTDNNDESEDKQTLFDKIMSFGGNLVSGICNFIGENKVLSGAIAAGVGALLYNGLKSSGLWDAYVVPTLDKLKEVVAEGIKEGWELIKEGGSDWQANNSHKINVKASTDSEGNIDYDKLIRSVALSYFDTGGKYDDTKQAERYLAQLKNDMIEGGYTEEDYNAYVTKLDTRLDEIVKEKGKNGKLPYQHGRYRTNEDLAIPTSVGKGKLITSIGRGKNSMKHFSQKDKRWGEKTIGINSDGSTANMTTGGCGMTSLAMVASSLGKAVTPNDVANMAITNGYVSEGGSNESLFTQGSSQLGLTSKRLNDNNSIIRSLQQNKKIIVAGKSGLHDGIYSPEGHIVTASGIDKRGNVTVNDPENRNSTKVGIKTFLNGITHAWSYEKGNSTVPNIGKTRKSLIGKAISNSPFGLNQTGVFVNNNILQKTSEVYKNRNKLKDSDYVNNLSVSVVKQLYNDHPELIQQYPYLKERTISVLGKDLLKTSNNYTASMKAAEQNTVISSLGLTKDGVITLPDNNQVRIVNGAVYYSQTDPRWAGTPIGNDTIGNSGCVVSSLAMAIASLLSKNINPGEVATRWKGAFNSSGAIKWNQFVEMVQQDTGLKGTVISNSNEALQYLSKNIPVVLYGKKNGNVYGTADGNNHAVLGLRNTTDGIIINDPGREKRSYNRYDPKSVTQGFKKGVVFTTANGSGLSYDGYNSTTFGTSEYVSGGNYNYDGTGQINTSKIPAWLESLAKPLMQIAGVMKNRIIAALNGTEYESVFDSNGNYIGPTEDGIFSTLFNNITGGGAFDDSAVRYVNGNWNAKEIMDQDLKLYGSDSITAEALNGWVQAKHNNSFWRDKGSIIMEASQRTGLDPRYILSHAIHETGWTPSKIAQDKYNYFGIGAFDASPYASANSWNGVEAGIIGGAEWINENYYNGRYGQTTLRKMRFNNGVHEYATDSGWASKIANIWAGAPPAEQGSEISTIHTTNNTTNTNTNTFTTEKRVFGGGGVSITDNSRSFSSNGRLFGGSGRSFGSIGKGKTKPNDELNKNYKELNSLFAKTSSIFGIDNTPTVGKGKGQQHVSVAEKLMRSIKPKSSKGMENFTANNIGQGRFIGKGSNGSYYNNLDNKLQLSLKTDSLDGKMDTMVSVMREVVQVLKAKESSQPSTTINNYNNNTAVVGKGRNSTPVVINSNNSNSSGSTNNGSSALRRQHDLITRGIRG